MLGRRFEETGHDDGERVDERVRPVRPRRRSRSRTTRFPRPPRCARTVPTTGTSGSAAPSGEHQDVAASAIPIVGAGRRQRRDRDLLAGGRQRAGRERMKIKVWGARGSIPAPGPETMRYGGNTSCVELTLSDGSTPDPRRRHRHPQPRSRPAARRAADPHPAHPPAPRPHPGADVLRPGVPARVRDHRSGARHRRRRRCATGSPATSRRRWRRSRSASCRRSMSFREAESLEWEHRPGPGQRPGRQPPRPDARLPDRGRRHVALLHPRPRARARRAAGAARRRLDLRLRARARRVAADPRLPVHRPRSTRTTSAGATRPMSDALEFARRVAAERLLLFHHDPLHSDEFLDALRRRGRDPLGGRSAVVPRQVEMATERREIVIADRRPQTAHASPRA